jgi:hypothetical protein
VGADAGQNRFFLVAGAVELSPLPHSLLSALRVNLALAYTELTEELGRLRELSSLQGRILRTLLQEQARSGGKKTPHRANSGGREGCHDNHSAS